MPPRGSEGLDFTPILTHYLFLFTSVLAVVAWFLTFISQAVATANFTNAAVGVLWFGIFLQLFLTLGVFYTLASDSIAMHRFQISTFGAVAIVFAVFGVDKGIFSHSASLEAMGAGWLLIAIVDILWVLYFTSEEDSLMLYVFNSMGTGGLTPPSRRRRTRTQASIHNMSMGANGGYTTNYSAGGGISSHDMPYDTKVGSALGSGGPGLRSQNSLAASMEGGGARSIGGNTGAGGSIHNAPSGGGPGSAGGANDGPHSPLMAGVGSGNISAGPSSGTAAEPSPQDAFSYKAKALYSYSASPDDPNEISFTKGDILDILDNKGKWWQARTLDGKIGIAPSNYLSLL